MRKITLHGRGRRGTCVGAAELEQRFLSLYGATADRKVGECFVKGMRVLLRRFEPQWEREVALVSRGQSAPYKKAIHLYWLASRKAQKASLIYLDSHQHVSITDIVSDLKEDPYPTLKSLTDAAKSHATRVCG